MGEKIKCKKMIWGTGAWHSHRCTRWAVKDGYCKIHHPDEVKKRRDAIIERQRQKFENSPIKKAYRRIVELEEEKEILIKELEKIAYSKGTNGVLERRDAIEFMRIAEEVLVKIKGDS